MLELPFQAIPLRMSPFVDNLFDPSLPFIAVQQYHVVINGPGSSLMAGIWAEESPFTSLISTTSSAVHYIMVPVLSNEDEDSLCFEISDRLFDIGTTRCIVPVRPQPDEDHLAVIDVSAWTLESQRYPALVDARKIGGGVFACSVSSKIRREHVRDLCGQDWTPDACVWLGCSSTPLVADEEQESWRACL